MTKTSFIFVGDIYLGEHQPLSLSPEAEGVFADADLVVANQEGPITDCREEIGGKGCLKSSVEAAGILCSWGVDVVTLANNHMFEYGWDGFEQTRRLLEEAGIAYLGAGKNLADATEPLIVDVKGLKIGLLAYSWGFVQTTCATENTFGCAPLDGELMVRQVKDLSSQVDAVIVLPHWGYCEYILPTPMEIDLAGRLIEAGATAVVGGHSHAVQGLVRQGDKIIAYNLGDFAFGESYMRGLFTRIQDRPIDGRRGIILKLSLSPRKVESHEVVFSFLREDGVIEIDDSPRRREEFTKRCSVLAGQDYPRNWQRYVRGRLMRRIVYWMNVLNWRKIHKETFVGIWLMLKNALFRAGKR